MPRRYQDAHLTLILRMQGYATSKSAACCRDGGALWIPVTGVDATVITERPKISPFVRDAQEVGVGDESA